MGMLKSLAILKAVGKLGFYFSFSMALMVWRETPLTSARSAWMSLFDFRNSRTLFFMRIVWYSQKPPLSR